MYTVQGCERGYHCAGRLFRGIVKRRCRHRLAVSGRIACVLLATLLASSAARAATWVKNIPTGGNVLNLAIDGLANVYASLPFSNDVVEINSSGALVRTFGTTGSGNGQLQSPNGVALDASGNLYVVDRGNNRIQEFSPSGQYLAQFGNGMFSSGRGIALNSAGQIFVGDQGHNRVVEFTAAGALVQTFGSSVLSSPQDVRIDVSGNVYVGDHDHNRIVEFNPAGNFLRSIGSSGSALGQFSQPYGFNFDQAGDLFVADWGNQRVQEFSPAGTFLSSFGSYGSGNGQFNYPCDLVLDSVGNVYVGDTYNSRLSVWSTSAAASAPLPSGAWSGLTGIALLVVSRATMRKLSAPFGGARGH